MKDEQKKKEEVKPSVQIEKDEAKVIKNKPNSDTYDQSVNKDVSEPELKVDIEKKGTSEGEMLQTDGADVCKIESKENKVNTTEQ